MSWSRASPSRRDLLGSLLAVGALGWTPRARAAGSGPRYLLIWWNAGGWDPTFVFDPHFDSSIIPRDPDATPLSAGDLTWSSNATRPSVDRLLTSHGTRSCIINGLNVGSIGHDSCTILALTGRRTAAAPDLPAMLAHATAQDRALPYLNLGGPRFMGEHGSVLAPVNHILGGTLAGNLPRTATVDPTAEALVESYLTDVAADVASGGDPRAQAIQAALQRRSQLVPYASVLELSVEPDTAEYVSLAVRAIQDDLARAIVIQAPLPNMVQWDSHVDNAYHQDAAFESSFSALADLIDTLHRAPGHDGGTLLDETLVLSMSEMGRAPALNAANGKDHWPYTSVLAIGGGISGGRVLGGTDDAQVSHPIDLSTGSPTPSGSVLTPANLMAGLLEAFDVDPTAYLPDIPPYRALFT
jgi:hypothetical protein